MPITNDSIVSEFEANRCVDTERVFRARTEVHEAMAATLNVVAVARRLLNEVDAALATASSAMMRQPRHADIPWVPHWEL